MSIDRIRAALTHARRDGQVDPQEVDRIMLKARSAGGLDAGERTELLHAADGFDDASKQRLLSHLSAMGQTNAWVNVESSGRVVRVEGRYASLGVGVRGLSAKVGLFDSAIALKGRAQEDGQLKLTVEGKTISIEVKKGDRPAVLIERLRAQLPSQVTGLALSGDLQPWEPADFDGAALTGTERAAHLVLYKPEALGLEAGEKPLRVVVTGYGAFMGITDNPSATLAQALAEQGVKGAVIEYRRLDVTTEAVDRFMAEMRSRPPDVILSMGVTGGKAQVEERPENALGASRDGNNAPIVAREVRPGGARELKSDLPVERIDWALSGFAGDRQVGTSVSDAGYRPDRSAYLCNYLGYNLASDFGAVGTTTAGFIHVTPRTPAEQLHAVLEAVVSNQLESRRAVS